MEPILDDLLTEREQFESIASSFTNLVFNRLRANFGASTLYRGKALVRPSFSNWALRQRSENGKKG